MKTLVLILIVSALIILYPSSADWTADEYIYSTGGVHQNTDHQWKDGTNLQVFGPAFYQGGTAGSQTVTGPGLSELTTSAKLSSSFVSGKELSYTGGGATWDTLTVNSMTPNVSELECSASQIVYTGQETVSGSTPNHVKAEGQTGAQGSSGTYISDKLVDTGTYALSSKFRGQGMFHSDWSTQTEKGYDKDSDTLQHTDESRRHLFGASNLSGGISASVDYTVNLMEFSDPFGLTPTNQTEVNETMNLTANLTEEP